MTTLADLLPPEVRVWAYAILSIVNAAYIAAELAYELPAWPLIIVAAVNAAGFQLAKTNTPTGAG